MVRPKIKDKLPEKLPPVEPDVKEEMEVTEEKLGPEITEDFIPDEEKVPVKTTHPEKEEAQASSSSPGEDARDKGKPDPGTGETDAKGAPKKKTTLLKYDPNIKLTDEQKEALEVEMDEERDKIEKEEEAEDEQEMLEAQDEANAKEDERQQVAEIKEEQPNLYGEADQVLNTLDTQLTYWNKELGKVYTAEEKLEEKKEDTLEIIVELQQAIKATRKHAPMTEDPAPPDQPGAVRATPEEFDKEQAKLKGESPLLPEVKTTPSSTDPAPEAPTSSAPVAKGAAERNKETEDLAGKFRNPTQPLPELLFPGDILVTSWEAGPYRVEKISGPFHGVEDPGGETLPSPDHYSIQCSDVDAKRNKDGRLPKNYEYSYLNMVIAVGNRFLSVYADSQDEVILTGEGVDKKKDISDQKPDPDQQPVKTDPMDEDIFEKEIY